MKPARRIQRIGPDAAAGFAAGALCGLVFAIAALAVLGSRVAVIALLLAGVAVLILGFAAAVIVRASNTDDEPLPALIERALSYGQTGAHVCRPTGTGRRR